MKTAAILFGFSAVVSAASSATGYVLTNITRSGDGSAYLANFSIGTPPQHQSLKVDSGSPTYSFLNPRSNQCQESDHPCTYGTYDNLTSSTSKYVSGGFNDLLIDHGHGDFTSDLVSLGGKAFNGTFGYLLNYSGFPEEIFKPTTTILGLSLNCQFAVGPNCTVGGPSLIQELYNQSVIDRRAFSLYLGPDKPQGVGQMIIGGYYDKAKLGGTPFTVPMADPTNVRLTNGQTNNANISRISVVPAKGAAGNRTDLAIGTPGVGEPTLIDSGNPLWYLPATIFNVLFKWLGSPTQKNTVEGYYFVDCGLANRTDSPSIEVEFASKANYSIRVPFTRLVSPLGNGSCVSWVYNVSNPSPGNGLSSLSDPFIRSTYITYDFKTFSISMAPVKYTTQSNIVPFPS